MKPAKIEVNPRFIRTSPKRAWGLESYSYGRRNQWGLSLFALFIFEIAIIFQKC